MEHDSAHGIVELLYNAGFDVSKMSNAEMLDQAKLLGWEPIKEPKSPYWMVHLLVFFMVMALGASIWFLTFQTLIIGAR